MDITREEIDERLARAAELRRTLRQATRRLMAFGAALLASREATQPDGARSR